MADVEPSVYTPPEPATLDSARRRKAVERLEALRALLHATDAAEAGSGDSGAALAISENPKETNDGEQPS